MSPEDRLDEAMKQVRLAAGDDDLDEETAQAIRDIHRDLAQAKGTVLREQAEAEHEPRA